MRKRYSLEIVLNILLEEDLENMVTSNLEFVVILNRCYKVVVD